MKNKKKKVHEFSPAELRRLKKEQDEQTQTPKTRISEYAKKRARFLSQNSIMKIWFQSMPFNQDESISLGVFTSRVVEGRKLYSMQDVVVPAKRVKISTALYFKREGYRLEVIEVKFLENGSKSLKLSAWLWNFEHFVPVNG